MYQPPPDLPEQIVTERLLLRPYRADDGDWYAEMSARNRLHLARYEAGNPAMTIRNAEDAEAVLRAFAADWDERRAFFLGCFLKDGGAFAGQIYLGRLGWEPPEFVLGYFADVEHTGRGYLTEAAPRPASPLHPQHRRIIPIPLDGTAKAQLHISTPLQGPVWSCRAVEMTRTMRCRQFNLVLHPGMCPR